jgi:hypothetical protein
MNVGPANAKLEAAKRIPIVTKEGWIYFVRGYDGMIKIGWARDVERRLVALQISSPVELVAMRVIRGPMADETKLHKRFAYLHVRGEWFKPGEELVEYIRKLEAPPGADQRPPLRKAPYELRALATPKAPPEG